MIKKCELCEGSFKARRAESRFCSLACRGKAHSLKMSSGFMKKCEICKKEFYAKKSRASKRFCSQLCNSQRYINRSIRSDGDTIFMQIAHDGTQTKICKCHFDLIKDFAWHLNPHRGYVVAATHSKKHISLHRIILGLQPGEIGDHINRDKLDNRCRNLRRVTPQQSSFNVGGRGSKSGFRGVYFRDNRWLAAVSKGGVLYKAGYFDNPVEAARARDIKAKELFGEYAFINLPDEANEAS